MSTEKRTNQQIRTVDRLLSAFRQERMGLPLARFLTGYYKQHPEMGSKDRRAASRLAYHYFRLGNAALQSETSLRLAIAEFLCSDESAVAEQLLPALYPAIRSSLEEKIFLLEQHTSFRLADVFPFREHLSTGIDPHRFVTSLFEQPALFLRLRPHTQAEVLAALEREGIDHRSFGTATVALPNGTALARVAGIAGKYEVQDYSSQETGRFFRASAGESWWDACAGAGGKSLLLLDNYPGVRLLVSDIRGSILRNLDERFQAAGIKSYRQKIIDLSKGNTTAILGQEQFDGIILDVPCSGSGTWGRTPEMITAFQAGSIQRFSALQRQIAGQVVKHLKPGKPLIYITCSVFADENEHVVQHLLAHHSLHLEHMEILRGYHHRADSMFVARLVAL
ncbi:RsmB/NOP family class I SAM-dependent RNA methyltransferase [Parapedobacter sp. ISTM3]|uniref:RsmB/NOP family class I SAM-dependent RNA methyltransferase n=1 Tax=Parapedobacter sp. ISTM3 TaxID=2800130 RepID=UPI001907A45A|nr:RsmB/NOP family class I SAM-dependent RNA methyltransferase [Parapedobacter sp. ISTM3]MBK1441481.1 RsmB/NOP family class I SAM-dependent RNA methyltransferase [Parapedobacter sp. ISTM3]